MAGGWNEGDLKGPFQPRPFCDSVILTHVPTATLHVSLLKMVTLHWCRVFIMKDRGI